METSLLWSSDSGSAVGGSAFQKCRRSSKRSFAKAEVIVGGHKLLHVSLTRTHNVWH
jgi:hypothetical protein